jgi:hypothetical protein
VYRSEETRDALYVDEAHPEQYHRDVVGVYDGAAIVVTGEEPAIPTFLETRAVVTKRSTPCSPRRDRTQLVVTSSNRYRRLP